VQSDLIKESEIEMALRSPLGHITSDGGGLDDGKGHPRSVGTFARFLRLYVREKKILTLMEGLRRITLLPAQRIQNGVAAMKKKGRLQEGSDADIAVFDPANVRERATYEEPGLRSEGIQFVLVNGTLVLEKSKVPENTAPGKWMRHYCGQTSAN
jgi:dihydroorotase